MPSMYDYQEALRQAEDKVKQARLADVAQKAGAAVTLCGDTTGSLRFFFFNDPVIIHIGESVTMHIAGRQQELPVEEKIILLHYLLQANGAPPAGQWITFRQIPDGHFYDVAFQRRTRTPFLLRFGHNPLLYRKCAEKLGGSHIEGGDVGMLFQALPNIPVQLLLWRGDEELPPESTLLFDAHISHYLPAEDIAVLSGMLIYRLIRVANSESLSLS